MKKLVTSNITDEARLPLLKRTLDFMKENAAETSTASIYTMLGSNDDSVPIVLWGCVPTITTTTLSNDTLTITEGAILYDGEIYQVSAGSSIFTAGQVHTLAIVATNQTGEPTKYTDDSEHATNINYTIAPSHGVTGSGICDWDDRLFASSENTQTASSGYICSIAISGGTGTISSVALYANKKGNTTTINGYIAITSTGLFIVMTLTLNPRYYQKNGDTFFQPKPLSAYTGTGSHLPAVMGNGPQGSEDKTILTVYNNTAVTTGIVAYYFFNFTYQSENLL